MKRRSLIKASALSLLAAPSIIHARGLSMLLGSSPSDGGGSTPYNAKAVHFAPPANITLNSSTAANSSLMTGSAWLRNPLDSINSHNTRFFSYAGVNSTNRCLISSSRIGDVSIETSDDTSGPDNLLDFYSNAGVIVANTWQHIFWYCNTNFPSGSRLYHILVDGVDVTDPAQTFEDGAAYQINVNGIAFGVPESNGSNFVRTFDIADEWVAFGQYITDVTKFRNPLTGKPVNLGPTGLLPTGVAPTFFFTGDASAFPVNQGTGGSFDLTGTITNATTSPSD